MRVLFVNAAFRPESRTYELAKHYLKRYKHDTIQTVELGSIDLLPMNRKLLAIYQRAVASRTYDHPMFDLAKQFRDADEIVIAAPFWNYSVPAILHSYLELACTQGIQFDMDDTGNYYSMCKARKLTYITTAGGEIPEEDHGFGYIASLADMFFGIEDLHYYKAECLDVYGIDTKQILENVKKEMDLKK